MKENNNSVNTSQAYEFIGNAICDSITKSLQNSTTAIAQYAIETKVIDEDEVELINENVEETTKKLKDLLVSILKAHQEDIMSIQKDIFLSSVMLLLESDPAAVSKILDMPADEIAGTAEGKKIISHIEEETEKALSAKIKEWLEVENSEK